MGPFDIKVDDRSLRKAFKRLRAQEVPFAAASFLTTIAVKAQEDLVKEMQRVFDRPTPWTLRAFYVNKASPRRLQAFVGIRDFAPKGTPAWKYLTPQVEGGARRMKRLELRLSELSGHQFVIPGRGARLDAYGNISRGQVGQILSRLGASSDPNQNMTDATTRRLRRKGMIARGAKSEYFIAKSKRDNRRPIGVYQLVSPGHVEPVLIFSPKAPTYRKRFDPDRVVLQATNRYAAAAIQKAIADELAHRKAHGK